MKDILFYKDEILRFTQYQNFEVDLFATAIYLPCVTTKLKLTDILSSEQCDTQIIEKDFFVLKSIIRGVAFFEFQPPRNKADDMNGGT